MPKEYYGQDPLIPEKYREKVGLGLIITLLIFICFSGQKVSIGGSSLWSEKIGIEYFINKHGNLLSLAGACLAFTGVILAYLVYQNGRLKKRIVLLENQIKTIQEKIDNF